MYQRHVMTFSLYPTIPYLQASDQSVTVGVVNTMLFIRTPISSTHWKIFIQSCRYCLWQDWRRCGINFFPLFIRLWSCFSKYVTGGILWPAWLSFPMRDYILSVFILLNLGMPWYCVPRLSHFIAVGIPVENGYGYPSPYRSCSWQADFLLRVYVVIGVHLVSGVCRTVEVWIWCGWLIKLRSWRAPPIVGCQW